jgi:hypothetical protein
VIAFTKSALLGKTTELDEEEEGTLETLDVLSEELAPLSAELAALEDAGAEEADDEGEERATLPQPAKDKIKIGLRIAIVFFIGYLREIDYEPHRKFQEKVTIVSF